jgi:hypothetical protein
VGIYTFYIINYSLFVRKRGVKKMLKMSNVIKIRDLSMEGKSKTEICKETGYDFKTVTKYLEKEDLSSVRR